MEINFVQLIIIIFKYYLLNYDEDKGESNFNMKHFVLKFHSFYLKEF